MVGGGVKHSETKGIRGSETEQTIPQSRSACQLPLHKGAKIGVSRPFLYAFSSVYISLFAFKKSNSLVMMMSLRI